MWGVPRALLGPKEYPDLYWKKAYAFALKKAKKKRVLAPEKIGLALVDNYESCDPNFDYGAIVLHKDRFGSVGRSLRHNLMSYSVEYENAVFFVLVKKKEDRKLVNFSKHYGALMDASTKRMAFVHIPKTAGTTIHTFMNKNLASFCLYGQMEQLLDDDHVSEYFNLAGHFYFSCLKKKKLAFDRIFTVLRDPQERFLSAFAHVRREENPENLGADMREMREMSLMDYLNTESAVEEVCAQSIYLGKNDHLGLNNIGDIRENALNMVRLKKIDVFSIEKMAELEAYFFDFLGVKPDFSRRKNVTQNKDDLFSAEEHKFIDTELSKYFDEETRFIKLLLS